MLTGGLSQTSDSRAFFRKTVIDRQFQQHRKPAGGIFGFTLVELLASMAILSILVTLTITGWPRILALAAGAKCVGNMRSLHVSLDSYISDVGHWPQVPEAIDIASSDDDSAYEDWWLNELKNYGGTQDVWQCPVIRSQISSKNPNGRPKIHYTPTSFDEKPSTPYKWSTQPWLVEIGNIHGRGAHICFTDGSIRSMDDVVGAK